MLTLAIVVALLSGAYGQADDSDPVLKRLVFGCQSGVTHVPLAERDGAVSARWRELGERCQAYAARTPAPAADSLEGMVALARWSYEQRLFAVAGGDVADEAGRYVAALRPCYEWEGFHDCPEREAAFADRYLKAHPSSPFAAYLPLLAAHRWLCTAEAYEYEMTSGVLASKPGVGLTRARLSYAQRLETARASRDPLIRVAADALAARGACF